MITLCLGAVLAVTAGAPVATQVVRADRIASEVVAALEERLRPDDLPASIALLGHLQDEVAPLGELKIAVGEVAGRWPRPRVGVPVSIKVDGRQVRKLTVWLGVSMPREAWVYQNHHRKGQPTDEIQMVRTEADLACCPGTPISAPSDLYGLRLREAVRAQQPAMQQDAEQVPAVQAHQPVQIEVVRGMVRIATAGRSLSDGRLGDAVNVLPDGSRVAIRARVTGEHMVAVHD